MKSFGGVCIGQEGKCFAIPPSPLWLLMLIWLSVSAFLWWIFCVEKVQVYFLPGPVLLSRPLPIWPQVRPASASESLLTHPQTNSHPQADELKGHLSKEHAGTGSFRTHSCYAFLDTCGALQKAVILLNKASAGVQAQQDPGVPSGWTASARDRDRERPDWWCAAESGKSLFFTVAFIF